MESSNGHDDHHNSRAAEPTLASNPHNPNSAAYLAYPVKHVVSSLYRRMTEPPDQPVSRLLDAPISFSGYYTPPKRTASPFSPPPLTPLTLKSQVSPSRLLLTRSLAEEVRLLVPPRLQLVDTWRLAYSLETDGASLHTLYNCCQRVAARSQRAGYVVVVRDSSSATNGAIFGSYLSDPPKPSLHYYGTGECFLWKASILSSVRFLHSGLNGNQDGEPPSEDLLELAGLPPPPSSDTTNLQRTTILRGDHTPKPQLSSPNGDLLLQLPSEPKSGASTPDRIRFKAFPYSGINDFMIYCESSYLSVGGGDGHYGLWLDDQLERGISDPCPTFGNESLSEEGHKFDVLGVEVWYIGA
jgi:TLD